MFLKQNNLNIPVCPSRCRSCLRWQRFDYMKFVSDAEQQKTTKHDVVRINQLISGNGIPACGDVAMAFPFLKGPLASPETEMQQIRREVMLGWPADALNQATTGCFIFQVCWITARCRS